MSSHAETRPIVAVSRDRKIDPAESLSQEPRRDAERLAALVQAQRELVNSDATLDQLIDRIPDLALSVVDSAAALFDIIDGDAMVCRAASAAVHDAIGLRIPMAVSLSGEAVRLNRTLRCDDIETDARVAAEACRAYGVRSMLVTVVRDRDGPIGVLKLVAYEPAHFGDAEADSLELLAEALGAVIQRKRAEEEARHSIRIQAGIVRLQQDTASSHADLQAMTEMLVAGAQELTAADGSAIALVEGGEMVYRAVSGIAVRRLGLRVEAAAHPAGLAAEHGEVQRCDDTGIDPRAHLQAFQKTGARSVMTAPVRAGNAVAGVLEVVSARPRAFGQREAGTLQILAEWLGVVMQRAAALHQLRLSESQYRLLFAANPLPMWVFDTETLRFLAVNDAAIARYGYAKDEFLSMTIKDIRPAAAGPVLDKYRARGDPGGQIAGVWAHRIKDGNFIDVEVSSNAIRFSGRPARLVLAHDVTERKRAERQLQKTEALLAIAGRVAHVAGWSFDFKARFFAYSDEACAMHELPAGSAVSLRQALDFYAPESRNAMLAAVNACALDGTPYDLELELITARGRRIGVRTIGQAVRNPAGVIVGTQGAVQDITERRLAQEALRSLNENLEAKVTERTLELELTNCALASKEEEIRSVVQHMADGVVNFDDSGTIRSANPKIEAIFGVAPAELAGRNVATLVPALSALARDLALQGGGEAGARFVHAPREARGLHRSGDGIALEVAVSEYRIKGQRLWTAILRDIGERVAIMADLEQARNDAEQASRAKSEFVATMSHEIRTPMNGVIGMIDVLEQTELAPEQATMLGLARDSAHSLMEIIEDILDFSKIEAGKVELECQPISVSVIVEKVCALVAGVAASKGVELTTRVDAAVPEAVWGDALRVRQVLVNLVTNAIKFSSGRGIVARVGVVVTTTRNAAGRVVLDLAVEDNGIGMDAATIGTLFKPFSQADASTTRRFGGTGLGLVISRHLVELMGGEISVSSMPDAGSTFTVRLPFEIAAGVAVESRSARGRDTGAGVQRRRVASPHREVILVAEDNEINQQVITAQLSLLGYTAEVVGNGRAALARWRSGDFAALLTDLQMPEMDGYDLAASVRREEGEGVRKPIIAFTANALKEESDRCKAVGMDDYLTKPVQLTTLEAALDRWLGRSRPDSAAPLPEPQRTPVDSDALARLVGDDPIVLDEFFADFVRTALQAGVALEGAVQAGDRRQAGAVAHRLKASARAVGAMRLGDLCADLESVAAGADDAALGAALFPIQAEMASVCSWVRARCAASATFIEGVCR